MNRFVLILLASIFLAMQAMPEAAAQRQGFVVKGRVVDERGCGVKGVVVNDGVNFTQTTRSGKWSLRIDTTVSKFISYSTPAAYELNAERGLARFYITTSEAVRTKKIIFRLRRRADKSDKFTYIAISDPQVKTQSNMARWRRETVGDICSFLYEHQPKNAVAVTLGDLVFDMMPLFPDYAASLERIGIPVFQTIGNHDFDKRYKDLHKMPAGTPVYAEQTYEDYFGPTDYSFNIGKVHVVTMKNIDYDGDRKYVEDITPAQYDWLARDLSYVAKGSTVFLNMHAAGWNKIAGGGNIRSAEKLEKVLRDYNVHVFCGHTHYYQNIVVSPKLYQHNIAAACGSWWAGNLSVCGAPNGYLVVDVDGDSVRWHYKSTDLPISTQMRLYRPGEFESQKEYLVANIWDWDENCKVEYYEDGALRAAPEKFVDTDENYIKQQMAKKGKRPKNLTGHLFRCRVAPGTRRATIVFSRPAFGERYEQSLDF